MAKPDKLDIIWGKNGVSVDPGDTKFELGWEAEIPPYQYFNYYMNKVSLMLDHINTYGIPTWDTTTEYKVNSRVSYGGFIWRCKVASSINAIPNSGSSDWTADLETPDNITHTGSVASLRSGDFTVNSLGANANVVLNANAGVNSDNVTIKTTQYTGTVSGSGIVISFAAGSTVLGVDAVISAYPTPWSFAVLSEEAVVDDNANTVTISNTSGFSGKSYKVLIRHT